MRLRPFFGAGHKSQWFLFVGEIEGVAEDSRRTEGIGVSGFSWVEAQPPVALLGRTAPTGVNWDAPTKRFAQEPSEQRARELASHLLGHDASGRAIMTVDCRGYKDPEAQRISWLKDMLALFRRWPSRNGSRANLFAI